jgi:Transposase DNA-binding/Transposase DDE domain
MDRSGWDATSWVDQELAGSTFKDERLGRRLRKLLVRMAGAVGAPIPLACQDWANTKAADRFLANEAVSEAEILAGHFRSTRSRVAAADGPILVLQDTTEFSYQRARPERIGAITTAPSRREANGRLRMHTVCGLLMHASLAVTTEGLPLGLAAVKFWTRAKFKGTNALKRRVNPTRVPIETKESIRWLENMRQATTLLGDPARLVHVGDRENDIYEFFCAAQAAGTHFLVRACVDRLAGDGRHTIADEMGEVAVQGLHRVEVAGEDGEASQASVELRYRRIHVRPPIGKQKRYPALNLTVIHAQERGEPEGRAAIDWKLITDLPVQSPEEAIEKLGWYARRWQIELFHKILKSGCRAEEARLRTAERLVNLLALFCILSWRLFWLTMLNRAAPDASPRLALTEGEVGLLDRMAGRTSNRSPPTLSSYLTQIARLGGYLARASDPPPGNTVMWRGWSRLMDIKLGAAIAGATCG